MVSASPRLSAVRGGLRYPRRICSLLEVRDTPVIGLLGRLLFPTLESLRPVQYRHR